MSGICVDVLELVVTNGCFWSTVHLLGAAVQLSLSMLGPP